MKTIFIIMCVAIALWVVALKLDAKFFGGRFLTKRSQKPEDFLRILEGIIEYEKRPIEQWPIEYSDWLSDKMYIPLQNNYLEKYRESIASIVDGKTTKEVLSAEAKQLFRKISEDIKSISNPKIFAESLKKDIERHQSGDFLNLGEDFGKFNALLPTDHPMREIPMRFWDAWCEESIHEFPGGYEGISKNDWPVLAEIVVNSVENGAAIENHFLRKNFEK